tara:strand:+ start:49 stop:798 length:750 start_codon:yes stop_codon:yes gene_type:complete
MEKEKKSFILYNDQRKIVDKLSNEQAGILLKLIYSYADGEQKDIDDLTIDVVFTGIQSTMDRDREKWELTKQKRSEAGKKGGRPPKDEKQSLNNKAKKANAFSEKQTKAKKAVNVNVNGNVNVNDNVIQKEKYKKESNLDFNDERIKKIKMELNDTHKLDTLGLLNNNAQMNEYFIKWLIYRDVNINKISRVKVHLTTFRNRLREYSANSIIDSIDKTFMNGTYPDFYLDNYDKKEKKQTERLSDFLPK